MKKTLLCLVIGIGSFYVGILTQRLFYWEKMEVDISIVQETEICDFVFSENNDYQKTSKDTSPRTLYIQLQEGSWGYYYNLPSSKGKHAPDFYIDGGLLYVRQLPSLLDLRHFEFTSVDYDEQNFSFETKEINGIRYSMKGILPSEENNFVIKGILIKYHKGMIEFKQKVVFRESIPTC